MNKAVKQRFYEVFPARSEAPLFQQILARGNELGIMLSEYVSASPYTLSCLLQNSFIEKGDPIDVNAFDDAFTFKKNLERICASDILDTTEQRRQAIIEETWNNYPLNSDSETTENMKNLTKEIFNLIVEKRSRNKHPILDV